MKFLRNICLSSLGLLMAAGCVSTEDSLEVSITTPKTREARVRLSAALDVTGLDNSNFAGRIVIDEIIVNVASLRLLGENPAIPVSGQPLIENDFILSTSPDAPIADFPFPSSMLHEHLAVYARIDQSNSLDHSSVIVRARLFDGPTVGFEQQLTSAGGTNEENTEEGSPNPDGEPNREESPNPDGEPNREESPNPDGEPNREESPNPDGEPNNEDPDGEGSRQSGLTVANAVSNDSQLRRALSFELHGSDQVEMVVVFDPSAQMNVTLSIPANRWLNADSLQKLEQALRAIHSPQGRTAHSAENGSKPLVLDQTNEVSDLNTQRENLPAEKEDYRLVSDDSKDPKRLRSR